MGGGFQNNFFGANIIDANGDFLSEAADYFKENPDSPIGKNYYITAIIGGQSTGKSTLLNEVFGTNFETLNVTKGRQQTTKGNYYLNPNYIV